MQLFEVARRDAGTRRGEGRLAGTAPGIELMRFAILADNEYVRLFLSPSERALGAVDLDAGDRHPVTVVTTFRGVNAVGDLSGRVVLVTGGNSGIGLAIAHACGRAGADVVVWGTNEAKNAAAEGKKEAKNAWADTKAGAQKAQNEIDAEIDKM